MITKNYIKMCEKAREIQNACKYEGGEIFSNVAGEIEIMQFNLIEKMKEWYKHYYHVWLPTQEQLQEMLELDPITILYLIERFVAQGEGYWHSFVKAPYPDPSMNELWFAFVMKEKYNKIWDGEKWK